MARTNYHIALQPGGFYHVMSRANGREQLFLSDENRRYFLHKYQQHLQPVAVTYAWCLLPNHFHLLVRIRPEHQLVTHYLACKGKTECPGHVLPDFVMERFSNWLNAYTKAFNKMYERRGSLFMDYLRREAICSDTQLAATLLYIHHNAVRHGCCKAAGDWIWSSYAEYRNRAYTIVSPEFVQRFFGTVGAFVRFHEQAGAPQGDHLLE